MDSQDGMAINLGTSAREMRRYGGRQMIVAEKV
jgi:hypothetical protein